MPERPSKDFYYIDIARAVARRGTCLRRNYGAVIVNRDQIISTGYTGAARGVTNCMDIGSCPRQATGAPKGQQYELCRSVHAEMNAVIHASRADMVGGTLYLVGVLAGSDHAIDDAEPCQLCKRAIVNAGITWVLTPGPSGQVTRYDVRAWVEQESVVSLDRAADGGESEEDAGATLLP